MSNEGTFVTGAVNIWNANIERADKLFLGLTPEQLEKEIAPGKNRLIYLWGHLTAVHDRMLPLLGFGERLRPEFDVLFLSHPDRTAPAPPPVEELKRAWDEVNGRLLTGFASLAPIDWLHKHASVSAEDYAQDPLRNRFGVLLSRTNHLAFHLGQTALIPK